jgi:hypothetical protein
MKKENSLGIQFRLAMHPCDRISQRPFIIHYSLRRDGPCAAAATAAAGSSDPARATWQNKLRSSCTRAVYCVELKLLGSRRKLLPYA